MAGAVGLDYGPLFHKLDRLGLTSEDFEQAEDDIRVMEDAALEQMNAGE